ncbi:MAG TPA: hypothetical protein PLD88_10705, partial [Candidatus Berkiella sp.]|nr:hypothetical protein [Candidatus Berkiella sp.]
MKELKLELSYKNNLSAVSITKILDALSFKAETEKLVLTAARLNKAAFNSLLKFIQACPLTRVEMTGTLLDRISQVLLDEALKIHPTLQFFHWSHGSISHESELNLKQNLQKAVQNTVFSLNKTYSPAY